MTYRYKRHDDRSIADPKARCSIRGDTMRPHEHYDPDKTASFSGEKSIIRIILALEAKSEHKLIHLYISSAFTAELYTHTEPLYVHQPTLFNGQISDPTKPNSKLLLNLYGSKPDAHTYFEVLATHLKSHGYHALNAYPCVFTKTTPKGSITAVITTDDFLLSAPTLTLIESFTAMLK